MSARIPSSHVHPQVARASSIASVRLPSSLRLAKAVSEANSSCIACASPRRCDGQRYLSLFQIAILYREILYEDNLYVNSARAMTGVNRPCGSTGEPMPIEDSASRSELRSVLRGPVQERTRRYTSNICDRGSNEGGMTDRTIPSPEQHIDNGRSHDGQQLTACLVVRELFDP